MGSLSSNPGRDWDSYIDSCERAHRRRLDEGLIPCEGDCGEYFLEEQLKPVDGDLYCVERCYAHARRRAAKQRLTRMQTRYECISYNRQMTGAEAADVIEGLIEGLAGNLNSALSRVYREGGSR